MKSLRVLVTDKCNANCPNCLNRGMRSNTKFMAVEKYAEVCEYFAANNVTNVRIMGGEPSLHPDFLKFVSISQSYFERVTVFTNCTNEIIKEFHPREKDGINYNFNFSDRITEEVINAHKNGNIALAVVLSNGSDPQHIIDEIERVHLLCDKVFVSLSFDCTLNIFKERQVLLQVFDAVYGFIQTHNIIVTIDHTLPLCFVYGTQIPIKKSGALCGVDCAGLLDSDYNMRFCNLNGNTSVNLFGSRGIIPFRIIQNYLTLDYFSNQARILNALCKNCPYYGEFCNGGCYMRNPNITEEDVIQNTEFPIM